MKKQRLIKRSIASLVALAISFTVCGCNIGSKKSVSSNPKDLDTLTFTSGDWNYDEANDLYFHELAYATSKAGNADEMMKVYVPGGYLDANRDNDKYSIAVAQDGRKNVYEAGKAPVVISIGERDLSAYANEGAVVAVMPESSSVIDIEMAVRALKYNAKEHKALFPACTDAYYIIGGNVAALAGVTADDEASEKLFKDYGSIMCYENGKAISDNVTGVIVDRPIAKSSIRSSAEAWMWTHLNDETRVGILAPADTYGNYINELKLVGDTDEILKLKEDDNGHLLKGSYADYVDYEIEQFIGEAGFKAIKEDNPKSISKSQSASDPTDAMYYLLQGGEETALAKYWQVGISTDNGGDFLCSMNLYIALQAHDKVSAGIIQYNSEAGMNEQAICDWIRTCTSTKR